MLRIFRKDALIVFALLSFVFAYFYQYAGWNGNSRFSLIFAAVQEQTFSIDHYYQKEGTATGDLSFANGHYYSDKAIGPAILGAIVYAPISWLQSLTGHPGVDTVEQILTFCVVGLPSAIAGTLMYLLCLYLCKKRARSFLITLAVTLGTMYFPYSTIFFSHQFTAALIFSGFFIIFFLKVGELAPKGGWLFLAGLLLGWAVISEYTSAAIVLPIAIYALVVIWRTPNLRRWKSLLLMALGGGIPLALQFVYNQVCFGSPFSVGYSNLPNQYFSASMSQGLMGIGWPNLQVLFYMTFHPTLGLFWQSPVLILALVGVVYGVKNKQYRSEVLLAIWLIVSYLVLISGYFMWWGGYALSSRHIIPILPFFCLLLVFLPDRLDWSMLVLGLLSFVQMGMAAATTVLVPDDHIAQLGTMPFFGYSNIYDYCLGQLRNLAFSENLGHRLFHLNRWASLVPFFVGVIGLIVLFLRMKRFPGRQVNKINIGGVRELPLQEQGSIPLRKSDLPGRARRGSSHPDEIHH